MTRPPYRSALVAVLAGTLVALTAPATGGGEWRWLADRLPPCPAGQPRPVAAPVSLPWPADPAACRARPSRVEPAAASQLPVPRPGHRHLGATTVEEWHGVTGRLEVRRVDVRAGSHDFVATRFLAKQPQSGTGQLAWLEVGWAHTGWSGRGEPRVYAFDSVAMSWLFFDEYQLGEGDRLWVYLHGEAGNAPATWYAWLWWGERWHLLAAPELPMGGAARLEQYVEVHLDRRRDPVPFPVPPIEVDQVRLHRTPGGPLVAWRPDQVATVSPTGSPYYCLTWYRRFDAWSAGSCPDTVQG